LRTKADRSFAVVYVHTNENDLKKAAETLAGTVSKFLPTTVSTN
jgi:hypothetical protein